MAKRVVRVSGVQVDAARLIVKRAAERGEEAPIAVQRIANAVKMPKDTGTAARVKGQPEVGAKASNGPAGG